MEVVVLEVRIGGPVEFRYDDVASATRSTWRDELDASGIGSSWSARGTFLEVEPPRRLVFRQALDFGPRSAKQEFRVTAEFRAEPRGTRLMMTVEATPSKHWNLLGRTNLEGQLDRLAKVLGPVDSARA